MNSDLKLNIDKGWSRVTTPLVQFWHWWTQELVEMIPSAWRQRIRGRERSIRFSRDLFEINEGNRRIEIPLAQAPEHPIFATWRTLGSRSLLSVVLPADELLRKMVTLPAATEPRLGAVLGYELDRHTPFSSSQAGFGYRVVHRDRAGGKIEVELFVLPDSKRVPILNALNEAGIKPDYLLPEGREYAASERRTLNLLGSDSAVRQQALRVRFPALLLLILALLVVFAFYRRDNRIAELEAEIVRQAPVAQQASQLKEEIESLQAGGQYIRQRKTEHPPILMLLDEMTRILPDHTWLNRLEVDSSDMRLQGESASASELIALLEQSALFTQAEFTSPVTINPRSRKERFSLTLSIAREEAP